MGLTGWLVVTLEVGTQIRSWTLKITDFEWKLI